MMNSSEIVQNIVAEFFGNQEVYLPRHYDEPETPRGWGAWVIEANVRPDPNPGSDHEPRRGGTRKLRGGAKVYISGVLWGAARRAIVVGRRGTLGEYLISAVNLEKLIALRTKVLYSPGVAKAICRAFIKHPDRKLPIPHTDCFFAEQSEAERTLEKIQESIEHILRIRAESAERRASARRNEDVAGSEDSP